MSRDPKSLLVSDKRGRLLKELAISLVDITLNSRQICLFEMLANGALSPLEGFMCRNDHEAVLNRMRTESGVLWPVPICLDIHETTAAGLEPGQSAALRDPEGFLLGVLHVEEIWKPDKKKEAQYLYGTSDPGHPAVQRLFRKTGKWYVGGRIEALSLPIHYDSRQLRHTPAQTRSLFKKLLWKRIIAYPTYSPIHRPQFEMTLRAMKKARANLLVMPVAGISRPEQFDHLTRIRCYKAIAGHYPPDSFLLCLLPLLPESTGLKAALMHLIVAKNYGCTHSLLTSQIFNPDIEGNGKAPGSFPDDDNLLSLLSEYEEEIGIQTLAYKKMVYLPFEDEYMPEDEVPQESQKISFDDREVLRRIRKGKKIPGWMTFPEVIEELQRFYPPPEKQGFTIFLTGLSGAGKSTIAKILYSRFLEIGTRPVTLLDGDIVRRHLSSRLSFSKEDRDINVRRIGFVAGEITKNKGIAICAPIAPYEETRREIRQGIEKYGGFIEVHVATPLEVCEKRDRKGMYAKAKAGLIKNFTGVDDPYEAPVNPELKIDTTDISPEDAAQQILLYLGQQRFI